jgi:hypothetical protein
LKEKKVFRRFVDFCFRSNFRSVVLSRVKHQVGTSKRNFNFDLNKMISTNFS